MVLSVRRGFRRYNGWRREVKVEGGGRKNAEDVCNAEQEELRELRKLKEEEAKEGSGRWAAQGQRRSQRRLEDGGKG